MPRRRRPASTRIDAHPSDGIPTIAHRVEMTDDRPLIPEDVDQRVRIFEAP